MFNLDYLINGKMVSSEEVASLPASRLSFGIPSNQDEFMLGLTGIVKDADGKIIVSSMAIIDNGLEWAEREASKLTAMPINDLMEIMDFTSDLISGKIRS